MYVYRTLPSMYVAVKQLSVVALLAEITTLALVINIIARSIGCTDNNKNLGMP